jgi:3-hydroxymyristoyl/3-hydroxydecanoyl-(acyl carrier protein) dehydratase
MASDPDLVIAPDHPALPGHFPGNPLVPGVLILGHVLAALERRTGPVRLSGIPQAKFLAPLAPGEPCTITFPGLGPGETRFECRSRERVIARGSLRFLSDERDAR